MFILCLLVPPADNICKQFGPRSGLTKRRFAVASILGVLYWSLFFMYIHSIVVSLLKTVVANSVNNIATVKGIYLPKALTCTTKYRSMFAQMYKFLVEKYIFILFAYEFFMVKIIPEIYQKLYVGALSSQVHNLH